MLLCINILKGIQYLDVIGTLICLGFICNLSSTDPFQKHIIGNLTQYFNDVPNDTTTDIEIQSNYSDDEPYHSYTEEEQILQGYKGDSTNLTIGKKSFLRKLDSDFSCSKYRIKFENSQGKKLSTIFDLRMKKIHGMSIGLIVVICLSKIFGLFYFHVGFDINSYQFCEVCCACLTEFVVLGSWITNLVLLIILAVNYSKGDFDKYVDFLECKNVKKNYFDKFSNVLKLNKYIIAFEVLDSIFELLETLFEINEVMEKNEERRSKYFHLTRY